MPSLVVRTRGVAWLLLLAGCPVAPTPGTDAVVDTHRVETDVVETDVVAPCVGDPATGDSDGDGVCDDRDVCPGDDATRDRDADGRCDDADACVGDDAQGDADGNGVCDDCRAGSRAADPALGAVVCVPPGTFTMGCSAGRDDVTGRCVGDENPARVVTLTRSIWVMEAEVTQARYEAVTGSNPSFFAGCPDCPVEGVRASDVVAFADAVSAAQGLTPCGKGDPYACDGWRLPTEAEWERAARGGEDFPYAGSADPDAVAWWGANSGGTTHPVCTLARNGFGLCDMSGNVAERTSDVYAPFGPDPATNPTGPASGGERVARGGTWIDREGTLRVAHRNGVARSFRSSWLGFRLVRTVPTTCSGDRDDDLGCDELELCFGDDATGDSDADRVCDDLDVCFGDDARGDTDGDGVCDDRDRCDGDDATGDADGDGVCDDVDLCDGDDAVGDADGDGVCEDRDVCRGDDRTGDSDGDRVCDDRDACPGDDAVADRDADGRCDDADACLGDDAQGDADGNGVCDDCRAGTITVHPDLGRVVCVPPGTFTMGCLEGRDDRSAGCSENARPTHEVTLTRSAWVMEAEVTQAQFAAILGWMPSGLVPCADCPVGSVLWRSAGELADAVSRAEGLRPCGQGDPYACDGWRLPTEAEWEYAARGGEDFAFAGSADRDAVAWWGANSGGTTHPVCTLARNGFGLCDMSGNVEEWTRDGYTTYDAAPATNPWSPAAGSHRAVRGGSSADFGSTLRVSVRQGVHEASPARWSGFRLVRTVPTTCSSDHDRDFVCDDQDPCFGDQATGDGDADGVCDDRDVCLGDDATGDYDDDGLCGDVDPCFGDQATGDQDSDGACDDRDVCLGDDALGDADGDGACDGCKAGTRQSVGTLGVVVCVPPGTFTTGCVAGRDDGPGACGRDEVPAWTVTLTRSMWVMETEVTQNSFRWVMGRNPSGRGSCSNCPVERVTWDETEAFADIVSRAEGLTPCGTVVDPHRCDGWRLPSETEWEYVARGGEDAPFAGGVDAGSVAWYAANSRYRPQPGCTLRRNGFGLCDLSGNVEEWTLDEYLGRRQPAAFDPAPRSSSSYAVVRGGSWADLAVDVRVARRVWVYDEARSDRRGFRLVRAVPSACSGDTDRDALCDDVDPCFGDHTTGDADGDRVCDDRDVCLGDDATGDADGDGLCDVPDLCDGDDVTGDADGDGLCDDVDPCFGDHATGDADGDRVCDDLDYCEGDDATGNPDWDDWCTDVDRCDGDNRTGDIDSDGICNDLDVCDGLEDTGFFEADCP